MSWHNFSYMSQEAGVSEPSKDSVPGVTKTFSEGPSQHLTCDEKHLGADIISVILGSPVNVFQATVLLKM